LSTRELKLPPELVNLLLKGVVLGTQHVELGLRQRVARSALDVDASAVD
jgi:hypothetical protein